MRRAPPSFGPLWCATLLAASAALWTPARAIPVGIAVLQTSSNSNVSGTVIFSKENVNDTLLAVDIVLHYLAPNSTHGFHIHTWGDLSDKMAMNTGPHFNPYNTTHGCINETTRHVGDMGSVTADANGNVVARKLLNASAIPGERNSIFGRAVVVHEKPDDCSVTFSPGTGNAGARYAQGVIGFATNYTMAPTTTVDPIPNPSLTTPPAAVAVLSYISGSEIRGAAYMTTSPTDRTSVSIRLFLAGFLPNAIHAIHIHTFGNVSSPDGASTQGHFNPLNKTHGCNTTAASTERHAGDLGNIQADGYGHMHLTITTQNLISLDPASPLSVIGRAIMVHEKQDDCMPTTPTGNAGKRFAQGVIGIANSTAVVKRIADEDITHLHVHGFDAAVRGVWGAWVAVVAAVVAAVGVVGVL
ncbi:hypothetical protein HK104_009962 [Borealophlyctis nickersoniae]|nr:hypothetical protein HK104_009962 [Borealophlyctis nickersoniae]